MSYINIIYVNLENVNQSNRSKCWFYLHLTSTLKKVNWVFVVWKKKSKPKQNYTLVITVQVLKPEETSSVRQSEFFFATVQTRKVGNWWQPRLLPQLSDLVFRRAELSEFKLKPVGLAAVWFSCQSASWPKNKKIALNWLRTGEDNHCLSTVIKGYYFYSSSTYFILRKNMQYNIYFGMHHHEA